MTPQAIEHEVELLHELLYKVECIDNLIIAHEVMDLNKYKVIKDSFRLRTFFRQRTLKPFEFLNCKN